MLVGPLWGDYAKIQHVSRTTEVSTKLQKGVQGQHISQVALGRRVKRKPERKATPEALAPPPLKTFCHANTTHCLRVADQLLPQQSLHSLCLSTAQDLSQCHTSLLWCWSHPSDAVKSQSWILNSQRLLSRYSLLLRQAHRDLFQTCAPKGHNY